MSKLTIVAVNGITYLGKLNEEETILEKALSTGSIPNFSAYLQAKNLGTLETIKFGGNGVNYSISPLTATQKLELKVCKLHMKQAKLTAAAKTENELFGELLGK